MSQTILIIDDEEIVLRLVETSLKRAGYTSLAATSAEQARELFAERRNDIDLILMDRYLKDADGTALIEELLAGGRPVPAILMSGEPLSEELNAAIRATTHFINKPFLPSELCGRIGEILGSLS